MVNNAIPGGERVGLHRICAVLQRSDPAASHARKEIVKKRLVRRVYVADYMSHDNLHATRKTRLWSVDGSVFS